jgi:hypothetical protein
MEGSMDVVVVGLELFAAVVRGWVRRRNVENKKRLMA